MQLRMAFAIWFALLIGLFVVSKVCAILGITQVVTLVYYLVAGILLSKKVLANLVTWENSIYNTIHNVSSAKLGYALLWIIRYPVLFFRLGIMKVL